ncbi:hypothetical protein ACHAQJ_006337 [Trichoderma viride]
MRLLKTDTIEIQSFDYGNIPPYAILSHRWATDELTYQDLEKGIKTKEGFKKVQQCCSRAKADGFDYVWSDTCCIDKTSSAELSEAINSMYLWYYQAERCYAYLADVPSKSTFEKSEWFTRGWTLQELLAPSEVYFVAQDWKDLGTKKSLQQTIANCTGIPVNILCGDDDLESASIAQRMSWAARRKTQRLEDRAYSLMGIFGINMPLLYGEGERAFFRLQEEIMKISDDHSLFAWESSDNRGGLLATSPEAFRGSGDIIQFNYFNDPNDALTINSKGVHLGVRFIGMGPQRVGLAILHCKKRSGEDKPVAIYVKDLSGTMETFQRVKNEKLEQFDPGKYKSEQFAMRRICIQTGRVTPMRKSKDPEKHDNSAQYEIYDDDKLEQVFTDRKALFHAAEKGLQDDVWLLFTQDKVEIDFKDQSGKTPLFYAVDNCQEAMVKILLGRGAKVNYTANSFEELLVLAAQKGNDGIFRLLLDEGAKVNARGRDNQTLLLLAAEKGHEGIVELLLDKGAKINISSSGGHTPLSFAAVNGRQGVVELLLEYGAEANTQDGKTKLPLLLAAAKGHEDIIKLLLDKGARVNVRDDQGRTPLLSAAFNGHQDTVKLLLENGAKFDVKDVKKHTPFLIAALKGHEGILELLFKKGTEAKIKDDSNQKLAFGDIIKLLDGEEPLDDKGAKSSWKDRITGRIFS